MALSFPAQQKGIVSKVGIEITRVQQVKHRFVVSSDVLAWGNLSCLLLLHQIPAGHRGRWFRIPLRFWFFGIVTDMPTRLSPGSLILLLKYQDILIVITAFIFKIIQLVVSNCLLFQSIPIDWGFSSFFIIYRYGYIQIRFGYTDSNPGIQHGV